MAGTPTINTKGFRDDRYRDLIRALVDARKAAKLSQESLADALGRHQQFVSRYETGERRLDAIEFVDIARALNCDPATIVGAVPAATKAKS